MQKNKAYTTIVGVNEGYDDAFVKCSNFYKPNCTNDELYYIYQNPKNLIPKSKLIETMYGRDKC